jgi:hypothetical protein
MTLAISSTLWLAINCPSKSSQQMTYSNESMKGAALQNIPPDGDTDHGKGISIKHRGPAILFSVFSSLDLPLNVFISPLSFQLLFSHSFIHFFLLVIF